MFVHRSRTVQELGNQNDRCLVRYLASQDRNSIISFTMKPLITISAFLLSSLLSAQYNDKGSVHISIGGGLGAYATEYDQTVTILGVGIRQTFTGGAATVTLPIEVQFGIAPVFSLGLYGEFGRYVDSVETKQNSIALFGLAPRLYLVNSDHFAWMLGLHAGATTLRIEDADGLGSPISKFAGSHFGMSTGLGFLFGEIVGLQLQLRYLAHQLPLREYELFDRVLDNKLYDADLKARGVDVKLALHIRL